MPDKFTKNSNEDDDDSGGKSGEIEFTYHDIASGPQRDDLLPESEKKRLLQVHQSIHEGRVIRQKQVREQRAAMKKGKKMGLQANFGGQGFGSSYKVHPISHKAQFAGIDRQNTFVPTENIAETNQDQREEIQLQYSLQYQPEYTPAPKNRLQLRRY